MKSHQGIQKKQPGPEPLGCLPQPPAVPIAIEPEQGQGDRVDRAVRELENARPNDAPANRRAIRMALETGAAGVGLTPGAQGDIGTNITDYLHI